MEVLVVLASRGVGKEDKMEVLVVLAGRGVGKEDKRETKQTMEEREALQ